MEIADFKSKKKWMLGIEDSKSPVEIGYFDLPIDVYHFHKNVYEYYLVASGDLTLEVEGKNIELHQGNVCCIEPGEKHQVAAGSKDLVCFLAKYPHKPEDKTIV